MALHHDCDYYTTGIAVFKPTGTIIRQQLRTPMLASVSYPTTKSNTGLIPAWADGVVSAATSSRTIQVPTVTQAGRSSLALAGFRQQSATRSCTGTPGPARPYYPYQPEGLVLDDEADILATLVPQHRTDTTQHVSFLSVISIDN